MPYRQIEQIKNYLMQSKKVLITSRREITGDGLCSALSLLHILRKLNKNADIIIDGFKAPQNFNFLQGLDQIKSEAKKIKKSIISLDISQTGLENLHYDIKDQTLRIHLTPKQGNFQAEDLNFKVSEFAYDLIITVDAPQIEDLGNLYDHHRDLFYQIPLINFDHSPTNEQYGHFNLIDITAASTTQIIYQMIKKLDLDVIDLSVADSLLAGLISKTKSFKTPQVTPEALTVAGELISLGADRKKIVSQLFQTKTISSLKLWGKILSRLETDPDYKMVWSRLDRHDFTDSKAGEQDISGVIEELILTNPQAEIVVLFYQTDPGQTKILLHSDKNQNALNLAKSFNPLGNQTSVSFKVEKELAEAEAAVLSKIKAQIV